MKEMFAFCLTGSWELTESNQQPGSLPGMDLGSLHIQDSCVAWSICGTETAPRDFTGSWKPIPQGIQRELYPSGQGWIALPN